MHGGGGKGEGGTGGTVLTFPFPDPHDDGDDPSGWLHLETFVHIPPLPSLPCCLHKNGKFLSPSPHTMPGWLMRQGGVCVCMPLSLCLLHEKEKLLYMMMSLSLPYFLPLHTHSTPLHLMCLYELEFLPFFPHSTDICFSVFESLLSCGVLARWLWLRLL